MIKRALCLLGAALFALAASQLPAYDQQYTQRLGGAVDELRIITERFDASAADMGLTRQDALARYAGSGDDFLIGQGRDMDATFARFIRLSAHLEALQTANPFERAMDFAHYYDTEIGTRALQAYEPAVPATLEGFGFAGAGAVLGYVLIWLVLGAVLLPFRGRRRARHA